MTGEQGLKRLQPFIGEWSLEMVMPGQPALPDIGARVTFEWMPGELWLIQRWKVPIPEAPDGIAMIGYDERRGSLLQHYFDQRGVARVYEMAFEDGVWRLERTKDDFSPFEFSQRFTGTFSDDGGRINGTWEIAHDKQTWTKDFDLNYVRVG
jgi:hypothetical protein